MNQAKLAAAMRAAINQAERHLQRLESVCRVQGVDCRAAVQEINRQHELLYRMAEMVEYMRMGLYEDDEKEYSGLISEE